LHDFENRAAMLVFACKRLPASLTTLDLSSLTTIPEGLKLPASLTTLYLSSLTTIPEGLKLPAKCRICRW
jgi:hypothetical protein